MPRWCRHLILAAVLLVLAGACATRCPGLFPESFSTAAMSARVRAQESHLIGVAERVAADPGSPTNLLDGSPMVARRDGDAVVGWRWVDGIPAKSYGPVYDPGGLIERYPDHLVSGDLAFSGCVPLYGPWWYCRLY
jgi:hypothetical protein